MNLSDHKKIIYLISILIIVLFVVGGLTFFIGSDSNDKFDLELEEGVVPEYINVIYTNGGFQSSNLIINENEVVFRNFAEYPIVLGADFDEFTEGVRLEEGEIHHYEFESTGEYHFEEQKSGLKLKITVKNIDDE